MTTAYPLSWPVAWPRTKYREQARFKTSLVDARNGVVRELELMGATGIVISSNAALNQNGQISARQPRLDDPAAVAYFVLNGRQLCVPSDRWNRLEDNLRAISLTIGALRGLDRWGAKEMVNAAFQGFQALPASTDGASWWRVLGVTHDASEVEIESAYRRLARQHHPDAGGDAEAFHQVNEAYRQAKVRRSA